MKGSKLFKIRSGGHTNTQNSMFKFYALGYVQMASGETLPSKCESPYENHTKKMPRPRSVIAKNRSCNLSLQRPHQKDNSDNLDKKIDKIGESPVNIFKRNNGKDEFLPTLNLRKQIDLKMNRPLEHQRLSSTLNWHRSAAGNKTLEILSSNQQLKPQLSSIYKIKWFGNSNEFMSVESRLSLGKVLGEGAFAKVYEAQEKSTGKKVAAKVFDKRLLSSASARKGVQNEVDVLSSLNHRAIVRILGVIEDQNSVCLVLENWGSFSLKEWVIEHGWDANAHAAVRDCGLALEYMHSRGFFHRDIKLTNIMVNEGRGCLVDFGMATRADPSAKEYLYCGTGPYLSPEMVSRTGYRLAPNDVWEFTVTLFRACSDEYPFGGSLS